MAGLYGADIAQLRQLGTQLNSTSTRLTSATGALSHQIHGTTAWKGSDASQFRADWDSRHRMLLEQVIQGLASAGNALRRNADEQEKTSAGTTGSSAGGGTSASGPGAGYTPGPASRSDHSLRRYPQQGSPDLDAGQLSRLRELVRDAGRNDDFFEGNDRDVTELREALHGLTPSQLDQFLKSLSDDDLRQLAAGAASDGNGVFNWEGTTPFERQQLLDQLLSKASPQEVERVKALIPWAQPGGEAKGDAARPGGAQGDLSNRWLTPGTAVIGEHQSKDDIHQGGYGTCVVMSAAGAMILDDPSWARDHVTDNGNGTVSVKLYDKDGDERWITVTKDLPATENGGLKGAQSMPGGIWPAYVEKALAQVYTDDDANDGEDANHTPDTARPPGSYRAIEGNYGPDVSAYLTGTPGEQTRDADKVWSAAANGQPVIVTTLSKDPEDPPAGYVAGHAFFVVGSRDGQVELQNPWSPGAPHVFMSKDDFQSKFGDATIMTK
jgi:hypothetical protein